MRRSIYPLPLLVTAALVPAAPAVARADSSAGAELTHCRSGDAAKDRFATYRGHMQAVPGSVRMAMRFKVIARFDGKDPKTVDNPQLKVWRKSNSGVSHFGYSQTVRGLSPGGSYWAVVKFRWYDSDGSLLKKARHVSETCVQAGKLPNLIVSGVKISPGGAAGTSVYRVRVANTGQGGAASFSLALFADGALIDSKTLDHLDAGRTATVEMNGPNCSHLRAVADSENTVPETDEDDNVLRSHCSPRSHDQRPFRR
jgi:hypothetical protein